MTTRSDKSWIQTRSGKRFDVLDPTPEMVDIVDIGHALSNLCRFTGQCSRFYSVAEHSIRVSFRCEELAPADKEHPAPFWWRPHSCRLGPRKHAARWGLLHDAAEAYVNDLNRPLKHQPELKLYRDIETRVMGAIAQKFQLGDEPPEVVTADDELLWTEVRDLLQPLHPDWNAGEPLAHVVIAGWSPDKARTMFFRRFGQLFPEWKP